MIVQTSNNANQLIAANNERNFFQNLGSGIATAANGVFSGIASVVNSAANVVTAVNPAAVVSAVNPAGMVNSVTNIPGLAQAAASVINPAAGLGGGLGGILGGANGQGAFFDSPTTNNNVDTKSSQTMILAAVGGVVLLILVFMFKKK